MGEPETKVAELCAGLGVTRRTPYRHPAVDGELRAGGLKLLGRHAKKPRSQPTGPASRLGDHADRATADDFWSALPAIH